MDGKFFARDKHSPALIALGLIAGATVALAFERFPSAAAFALVGLLAAALSLRANTIFPLALVAGAGLALLSAYFAMASRLSPADEGVPLRVEAVISGLPQVEQAQTRFQARVVGHGEVRLGWYGAPVLKVGERWNLTVKLKRPRGSINPGTLDFEQLALRQGLIATGYVQHGEKQSTAAPEAALARLRMHLSERIASALGPAPSTALVQALALGDQRNMTQQQWELLRASGTTHLFAISGFHIGMIGLFCLLTLRALLRLLPPFGQAIAVYPWFKLIAVMVALAYGLLVGFAVPTARTCLLMLLFAALLMMRKRIDVVHALLLVGGLIVLVDPLSVLAPGFWLSFLSVGALIYALGGRPRQAVFGELVQAQWASTVLLLPLTLYFFGQFSFAAVPANFLAIPLISLLVVPLALLGTAAEGMLAGAGVLLLWLAAWLLECLFFVLARLSELFAALTLYALDLSFWRCALAVLGGLIALAPRGLPGRGLGLVALLLLLPPPDNLPLGAWRLTVFDVGQGSAMLLETKNQRMVIDTGPAFGATSDAGSRVVVPSLRLRGIDRLDRVVVSHGDQDHAGGLKSLLRYFPAEVLSSDPSIRTLACLAPQTFSFDQVSVHVLHPTPGLPYLKNESSCVLKIESIAGSALLPGDIGEVIEARLVRDQRDALAADVIVVPHHGSLSSSTEAFIAAVSPQLALISAGFQNRFGFPREEVLARYRRAQVELANTALDGQLVVLAQPGAPIELKRTREHMQTLWRE